MTAKTVLIVDDEPDIRQLLDITLSRMGLETRTAADLAEARAALDAGGTDLCLTDMKLPDGNGISLVEHIAQHHSDTPVAMITAHGSVETAITALKAGAFDFISKPIELERLRSLVVNALKLEPGSGGEVQDTTLIGETQEIADLRAQVTKLARSQAPVYISGESGSGKEIVARLIHSRGPRSSGPFIPVNCGAIPPELMESELFGHTKGSFTGATDDKTGLFQAARGGTLFLDEVADLPMAMQVKLLRAIQEKAVRPIGASAEVATDVRVLSATHKDLAREVAENRFRSDLYYRINVIGLHVPSLRERRQDIPLLANFLLQRLANASEQPIQRLSDEAMEALVAYDFPGNVRELENILERACTLCSGERIEVDDLRLSQGIDLEPTPEPVSHAGPPPVEEAFGNLDDYLENIEREVLTRALEQSRWNKTAAAKLLGISFRSLRYRLKKLELDD
ncbi:MAG: sigma-54 dependent transcriptional regulator [Halieaceae bacterium]|jgi:two-component system response regulator PilR (NtrC family)|nr:sigma-54 dependent transcriptional regulator [Halieaceae bacterium]